MGALTGIVKKHQIPVFAMKDTEESYAMNQFANFLVLHLTMVHALKDVTVSAEGPWVILPTFAVVTMDGKVKTAINAGLTGIVQIKKIMPAMNQMNAYAIRDLTQINFVQKNIHWLNKFQIQSFSKIRIW